MDMVVSHWSASLLVVAVYLVVAGAHLLGMRSLAAGWAGTGAAGSTPAGTPRAGSAGSGTAGAGTSERPAQAVWQAAFFHTGLLVVLLALISPVGYWAQHYMWVRSVQDLLLANVSAGLIVLGGPWPALRRGLRLDHLRLGPLRPGRLRPGRLRPGRLRPGGGRRAGAPATAGWSRLPLLVVAAFNLVWCGWHLPVFYDAALAHPPVYAAEIISYLGLGVLFWWQIIGSGTASPRLAPLRRVMALGATVVVGTVLGMTLVFGSAIVYTGYLTAHRAGYAVLADQQAAGAVLWVLMLPSYTVAAVALGVRWLNDEETEAFSSGLDRLLKPAKSAWPSRPGLR